MAVLEVEAKLTGRYQNTVPAAIRKTLHLGKYDTVVYKVEDSGRVYMERRTNLNKEEDPVVGAYLDLLARDIAAGNVKAITPDFVERMQSLVAGVKADLNAPLDPNDE